MKATTTLPPIRVPRKVRERIESVLEEGETLSAFMLDAVTRKAEVRREQRAFVAKALARSKEVARTRRSVSADEVYGRLEQVLERAKKRTSPR